MRGEEGTGEVGRGRPDGRGGEGKEKKGGKFLDPPLSLAMAIHPWING